MNKCKTQVKVAHNQKAKTLKNENTVKIHTRQDSAWHMKNLW